MHHTTVNVRQPAVAGSFYPGNAADLRRQVNRFLRDARSVGPYPKALIVPHAGYDYSGPVAASGYRLLKPIEELVRRVVLVGPAHRVSFFGLAASDADEFATPLGNVPVDQKSLGTLLRLPQVQILEEAHRLEHSLEVQLPFLQLTLHEFSVVPLLIGRARPHQVRDVLRMWCDDAETLMVVSSDLSHFHTYPTARRIDSETSHLIERCQWQRINGQRACGHLGIRGLLQVAAELDYHVQTVDLRNSGDTYRSADPSSLDKVVGYGSFIVYQ